MSNAYQIMGRTFQAYQLALMTIGVLGFFIVPNPFARSKPPTIKIQASSKEEEEFIKDYLKRHQ